MTLDIILTLAILGAAIVLFVGEWIRPDLTALMLLSALVLTGLVSPEESIAGFSNPAVVTTWAVFILSTGLSRTGVSPWLGRQVLRLAGKTEPRLLAVLMSISASISGFIYSAGVTAVFLPVTSNISRKTGRPASRLMLPMAYGCLVGGMLTMIGTASNLVVADFVRSFNLTPLKLFDFTPIGLTIVAIVILYMSTLGHRMLPVKRRPQPSSEDGRIRIPTAELYGIRERLAVITIQEDSLLIGKTLSESRFGPALGLNILRVQRLEGTRVVPVPELIIEEGDRLLVLGRIEALEELASRPMLHIENGQPSVSRLFSNSIGLVELEITPKSVFNNKNLRQLDARRTMGLNVLAIRRGTILRRTGLADIIFQPDDKVLAQVNLNYIDSIINHPGFVRLDESEVSDYQLSERLITATIPIGSSLIGRTLLETRLASAFGISVISIRSEDHDYCMPLPETVLKENDQLVIEGRPEDLAALKGLQNLQVDREAQLNLRELEDGHMGVVEVMLSPHSSIAGKTIKDLRIRERFGISILAVWRGDRPYRTGLANIPLRLGDAFLCYGPRESFELMAAERDFVLLESNVHEDLRIKKAPLAGLIMAAVVGVVVLGLLPIYIAAICGAVMMVLTRCLTMEEAYRGIEWKVVFLIAAMLPVGAAMQKTGAAYLLGGAVINLTSPYGPAAALFGLMTLTMILNQFIPSAVNAVVMTPIALATAMEMGVSPYPFAMGIAYSVASSFMTPVSHPALVLVMSPGNYRFSDYVKNGLPVLLIVLAVCTVLLPVVFPF